MLVLLFKPLIHNWFDNEYQVEKKYKKVNSEWNNKAAIEEWRSNKFETSSFLRKAAIPVSSLSSS